MSRNKISRLASLALGGAALIGLADCASVNGSKASVKSASPESAQASGSGNRVDFRFGPDREENIYEGIIGGQKFAYLEWTRVPAYGSNGSPEKTFGNSLRVFKIDGTVVTFEDSSDYNSIHSDKFAGDHGRDTVDKLYITPAGTDNIMTIGRDGPKSYSAGMSVEDSTAIMNRACEEYGNFRLSILEIIKAQEKARLDENLARVKLQ